MSAAGRGDLGHCGTEEKPQEQQESTLAMARMKREEYGNVQAGVDIVTNRMADNRGELNIHSKKKFLIPCDF